MSELGPRAREILRSGRELHRPTAADRERNEHALRERLGAALSSSESNKPKAAVRPRWPFVKALVIGAGLLGGGVFFASKRTPLVVSPPQALVSSVVSESSTATPPAAPELPAPDAAKELGRHSEPESPPLAAASERSVSSARPAEDRLAQEVALLARATSRLHAGHPADALKVLDEYQRRFPKGMLTEERRAAKAQALCALGRQGEADAELARLAPHSLAAARAKQVCAAHAASKP